MSKGQTQKCLVCEQNHQFSFNVYCFCMRKIGYVRLIRNHNQQKEPLLCENFPTLFRSSVAVKHRGKPDDRSLDFHSVYPAVGCEICSVDIFCYFLNAFHICLLSIPGADPYLLLRETRENFPQGNLLTLPILWFFF